MESECDHYFLTTTAKQIWQEDDEQGMRQMYDCLCAVHKEAFFCSLIYDKKERRDSPMREMAEDAFTDAWLEFNTRGRSGLLVIDRSTYIPYFRRMLKGKFIDSLRKEKARQLKEQAYRHLHPEYDQEDVSDNFLEDLLKKAWQRLGQNCRNLLVWRHKESKSIGWIAEQKGKSPENISKMVHSCKLRLLELIRGTQL